VTRKIKKIEPQTEPPQIKGLKLDLGCGEDKHPGFVGIDIRPLPNVDVVWDLEQVPYPFPDECATTILALHVVEHLNPHKGAFLAVMDELWRLLEPDGELAITTPYAGSPGYWSDPTHVNPCTEQTWYHFDPLHPSKYYYVYRPKPWYIKVNHFDLYGHNEVVLVKRRDDISYHAKRPQ
jgi:SAM-dependent methyltransferase